MTNPKMIFCQASNADTVLNACSMITLKCPVVAVKTGEQETISEGVIDFAYVIKKTGIYLIYT